MEIPGRRKLLPRVDKSAPIWYSMVHSLRMSGGPDAYSSKGSFPFWTVGDPMRRPVGVVLILAIWLGPLLAVLQASDASRLPPCCRRDGAHHCAMSDAVRARMVQAASGKPGLTAPAHCPLYPNGVFAAEAPTYGLAASAGGVPTFFFVENSPAAIRAAAHRSLRPTLADRAPPGPISS
jgi:hypothetical protein